MKIVVHVILWLALYLLPYVLAHNGKPDLSTMFSHPGDVVHLISTVILIVFTYSNYFWLIPKIYFRKGHLLYILVMIVCFAMVIWFPNLFAPHWKMSPQMKSGDAQPHPILFGKTYNIILFLISTYFSVAIHSRNRLIGMEKEKINSELLFLKTQINPHFLFNTLNSIYSLAIKKSNETPKAIIQLSELMRYILRDAADGQVLLDRELNYIDNYINLHKHRLGESVRINYTVSGEPKQLKIEPLLLISFIENAFKHGVNPNEDSEITITITVEDTALNMFVKNNNVSSVEREGFTGIGLPNTVDRLKYLYKDKFTLDIKDEEKTFSINLTINLA